MGSVYLELPMPVSLLQTSRAYIWTRREKMCIHLNMHVKDLYPLPIPLLPTPIASLMRRWSALFGEKTDLIYWVSRDWPSLPHIQTSRQSSAALFQRLLPYEVQSLRFNEPSSAKRKGSTGMAATLPVSARHWRKNELGRFETGCQLYF